MKKKTIEIALSLIFILLFNFLLFLYRPFHEVTVIEWCSYAFIHGAYVVMLSTLFCSGRDKRLTLLSLTQAYLGILYFIVAFITGLIFILIRPEVILFGVAIQSIVAALFIALLLGNSWAGDHTEESIKAQQKSTGLLRGLASDLSMLAQYTPTYKDKLLSLSEEILRSPSGNTSGEPQTLDEPLVKAVEQVVILIQENASAELIVPALADLQTTLRVRNRSVLVQ